MRILLFPGPTWNSCEVLTRGLRGCNTSGVGLAPWGNHYLLTLVSSCPSVAPVLGGGGDDYVCQA